MTGAGWTNSRIILRSDFEFQLYYEFDDLIRLQYNLKSGYEIFQLLYTTLD